MWLTSSSIGRKFVMALTGACLVLFVTFHVVMNSVCILWPTAYNVVCMFLGANWYALIASAGLGVLVILHIIYAVWLTLQNRKARGADRYEVTSRPPQVEWASKNMLVLGIVILAFLVVHLINFWAKMQLQELLGTTATVEGVDAAPEFGTLFIQAAFSTVWVPIVYLVGFVALWFHMNHGFWSMFQSVGWNNGIWLQRLKTIGLWWTSIVIGLFICEGIVFMVQSHRNYYLTDGDLQEQYAEYWIEKYSDTMAEVQSLSAELNDKIYKMEITPQQANEMAKPQLDKFADKVLAIEAAIQVQCPDVKNQQIMEIKQIADQVNQDRQRQAATTAQPQQDQPQMEEMELTEEDVELN